MVELTHGTFKPHEGTVFTLLIGSERFELRLDEVRLGQFFDNQPRAEPFSLQFSGPADRRLEQGTYEFQHDELGTVEIFVVPTGPTSYEAVFN